MAKIPVRVGANGFKGLNPGAETTMSISRAREAVDAGQVEYIDTSKKAATKRTAKKAARKVTKKSTVTKAARSERTRTMAGRSKTK